MTKLAKIVAIALTMTSACLTATGAGADELTPQKEADIRKLLNVSGGVAGVDALIDAVSGQFVDVIKETNAQITPAQEHVIREVVRSTFMKEFNAAGGLFDQLVPVYGKHFTREEVAALLAFYETPTGRKFASAQPLLVQESAKVGEAWGREIGTKLPDLIVQALKEKGF